MLAVIYKNAAASCLKLNHKQQAQLTRTLSWAFNQVKQNFSLQRWDTLKTGKNH